MSTRQGGAAARFWELVNAERASRGWTWTRLARDSGVERSTMHKWKTRPNPPQAATVIAVADALSINRIRALRRAGVLGLDGEERRTAESLQRAADEWAEAERDEEDA